MYGMKEKNLAKAYIKIIPLGARDPDAMRLLNWKKPTDKDVREVDSISTQATAHLSYRNRRETSQPFYMKLFANGLL